MGFATGGVPPWGAARLLLEVRAVPRVRAGVGRARRFGRGGLNATPNTPMMDGVAEEVRVLLGMVITKTLTLTRQLDGE